MANEKQPYILISLYISLYKERYNKVVTINKFREKWAMQDVIDSVGYHYASRASSLCLSESILSLISCSARTISEDILS